MNNAHFKVKSVINLENVKQGDIIPTSDFASITPGGNFVQLEYIENEKEIPKLEVKPGIYTIVKTPMGLNIQETSFTNDKILEEFLYTKEVVDKVDCFFRNLHKYKEFGIEIPKRGVLLYGPPGTGKSSSLTKIIKKYSEEKDTLVLTWDTTKYEAFQVKDLIKGFEYKGVNKLILIIEDIGGMEHDSYRQGADSALLSLLDNQEKTFTIATCVIATTNHPEQFMASLTNRSGRFDDKIKVGFPPSEARKELLKFFAKNEISEKALELIGSSSCEKFPPAHIKEIIIRSAIHEKSHEDVIKEMIDEIKRYEKGFEDKTSRMGFGE